MTKAILKICTKCKELRAKREPVCERCRREEYVTKSHKSPYDKQINIVGARVK